MYRHTPETRLCLKNMLKTKKNEKRSPLQNLNSLHFHKSSTRKPSNLSSSSSSSSSAAASVEARNGCFRFLRSSDSSSDASLPSSSSRTPLDRKPKSLPKVAADLSAKPFRSKENELPTKPFSGKSEKKQQLCLGRRENGKPICKTAQRSKLSSDRGDQLKITKKVCEGLEGRKLKSNGPRIRCFTPTGSLDVRRNAAENSNLVEPPIRSFTPTGSLDVRRNAAENSNLVKPPIRSFTPTGNSGVRRNAAPAANGGSATSAKTPPVEASMSPEIQSKNVVSKSAATPVCYGAGHLLSGVTDKRKCRRRGSLRGGCEKINLFNDDEEKDKNVVEKIPLPAEASVRWLLSPCEEGGEDQGSDLKSKLEECEMNCGNASPSLDLLSDYNDAGNVSKDGGFMVSFQENFELELGENLDKKMGDCLLSDSPKSISNYNSVNFSENSSTLSLGCLSSGNIVQSPNSESSWRSYECVRRLNVEGDEFEREISNIGMDSSCLSIIGSQVSWRDGRSEDEENDVSPMPKEERMNSCAESICTNGGDLAASCDSDWTLFISNE